MHTWVLSSFFPTYKKNKGKDTKGKEIQGKEKEKKRQLFLCPERKL